MSIPEQQEQSSLSQHREKLSAELQSLLPAENLRYYEQTNGMHCGAGTEGGSKFHDSKIKDIFDVVQAYPELAEKVRQRVDDRAALQAAGAPESAFLPATKGPDAPEGQPEALYFKVDGIQGKLGIIKLSTLSPDTKVLVRREKGSRDKSAKDYTPVSLTVFSESDDAFPATDFATIIVGRSGGASGADAVWTTHPGAPVRPAMKEFSWSSDLESPVDGVEQMVRLVTVGQLMDSGDLSGDDYIKIAHGSIDTMSQKYRVLE